jgi:hypothetical protein
MITKAQVFITTKTTNMHVALGLDLIPLLQMTPRITNSF